MRDITFLGLVLALSASVAAAECPTRSAMAEGRAAYVTYPDDSRVALKWLGEGMVQETTRYPDGEGEFRMISMGGVFIVDEVDLDGSKEVASTRISTRYPDEIYSRVPLAPGQTFKLVAVNRFADGAEPEDEFITVQTGQPAVTSFDGCSYTAFPVLITYRWNNGEFTSMMSHVPELGVSLEVARVDEGTIFEPFAPRYFDLEQP